MKYGLIALTLACSVPAMAASVVTISDNVGYSGTGCPQNSASIVLSPDGTQLSVGFDSYATEAYPVDPSQPRWAVNKDRRNCLLQVPLNIPEGYQVTVTKIDTRGYVSLPTRSSASLVHRMYFTGQSGAIFRKKFSGPTVQDYLERKQLVVTSSAPMDFWSRCDRRSAILNINTAMDVSNSSRTEAAQATVDSIDMDASETIYYITKRSCLVNR